MRLLKYRKKIALSLLSIISFELLSPAAVYALTSGPAQPEISTFESAGTTEMVDLSTGAFKYNIPLLDVDGYPVNLSYQSGVGMEDEASWVGLGWNINVGAINRQLRGLPDDVSGDEVLTEHYVKPKVTVGGKLTGKIEISGRDKDASGNKINKGVEATASLSCALFYDNYTGMGAELGANAGISLSMLNDGNLTAGLGLGILSSTASGVSANASPYINLAIKKKAINKYLNSAGLSGNIGYNSRSGMKDLTLGKSFSAQAPLNNNSDSKIKNLTFTGSSSTSMITFNTEPIYPSVEAPFVTNYTSISFDVGGSLGIFFAGAGFSGYKSVKQVASPKFSSEAYGYLYADRAKGNSKALMDFTREKDNPIIPELPYIAIPVALPDLFSFSSQVGGGQFRLFRNIGAFGDQMVDDISKVNSLGGDLGFGTSSIHFGVTYFNQNARTSNRRWQNRNSFLAVGDFQSPSADAREHVYFKMVGEKGLENKNFFNDRIFGTELLSVDINKVGSKKNFKGKSTINSALYQTDRSSRKEVISYLTAKEATAEGLDRNIISHPFNYFENIEDDNIPTPATTSVTTINRQGDYRKPHHLSEINITGSNGERHVYGIPVYNLKQEEYSFALGNLGVYNQNSNVVSYNTQANGNINHKVGFDHYYHKEVQPAYASSFLLTGILSPDYIDNDGVKGISAGDYGTAIKFKYSKLSDTYKWRTPYGNKTAILSKGQLAEQFDDKGSIVYGEKEIWYTHSIETKNMIACFILEDRNDAAGVLNIEGNKGSVKQKRLKEIRLYTKANPDKPIKVVKFAYSYDLCSGVPNTHNGSGGKLTLTRVWFEYANSNKGKHHYYEFSYANNKPYQLLASDRWGSFKAVSAMGNDEFPYAEQNKTTADEAAGAWCLNRIVLPSGGIIQVEYEAGDYAYVQDKRAMEMRPIASLTNSNDAEIPINNINNRQITSLENADGIKINLPEDIPSNLTGNLKNWFCNYYLNRSEYMYVKALVKMATFYSESVAGKDYDYIPVYLKVTEVKKVDDETVIVKAEPVSNYFPLRVAAWQKMKNEYPRYSYRGFSDVPNADVNIEKAVKAAANAFKNLDELRGDFNSRAKGKGFAKELDLSRSVVRLAKVDGFKLGGPSRVKKITINDDWQQMTGNSSASYGQSYEYTRLEGDQVISSGVAANEPTVGADENPLRQPIPYVQRIVGASSNFFSLEEPLGESFFPAPHIVYSKVTVKDIVPGNIFGFVPETGSTVHEYYTAKDFPVIVKASPLESARSKSTPLFNFISGMSTDELCLSQGYSIEVNDMHGQLKATREFNKSGAEISSTIYYYHTENSGTPSQKLRNEVDVVDGSTNTISKQYLGREIDFYTDMREQESNNTGITIATGSDVINLGFIVLPLPHFPSYDNNDYKRFTSVSAVKIIQSYGIVKEVIKTIDGSSSVTQHLVYDALTGNAVVSRSENEYKQFVYQVNLPAYWAYKGMGGAYKNQDFILEKSAMDAQGYISEAKWVNLLSAGDELIGEGEEQRYWVIEKTKKIIPPTVNQVCPTITNGNYRCLINKSGEIINQLPSRLKLYRSHRRNLLEASMMTYSTLENPIKQNKLVVNDIDGDLKVLQATALTYHDQWGFPELADERVINLPTKRFDFDRQGADQARYGSEMRWCHAENNWIDLFEGCNSYTNYYYLMQALNRSRVWLTRDVPNHEIIEKPLGFITEFTVDESRNYTVGFSGDDEITVYIDDCLIGSNYNAKKWVMVTKYLTSGTHKLEIIGKNRSIGDNSFNENPAAVGLEIYKSTEQQLKDADANGNLPGGGQIDRVYTTLNILNEKETLRSFRTDANGNRVYRFAQTFNPYHKGFAGNWKMHESKVFQEKRQDYHFASQTNGAQISKSGYIKNFNGYWFHSGGVWSGRANDHKWITSNEVTLYSPYGEELENKNALGIYSSAKFSFNGRLPAAVASNAKEREIYTEGFEDSKSRGTSCKDTCGKKEFRNPQDGWKAIYEYSTPSVAHSGNYSILMPSLLSFTSKLKSTSHKAGSYLTKKPNEEFELFSNSGKYPRGFEPENNKQYLLTAWVKDNNQLAYNQSPLVVMLNGANLTVGAPKAIVEGWKLIMVNINLSQSAEGANFQLDLIRKAGVNTLYLDDIRIHPISSNMKTFVYHDKNYRLMAELDENAFATFYEYDDEGRLNRVKKETQKGIVMLKESRSSTIKKLVP